MSVGPCSCGDTASTDSEMQLGGHIGAVSHADEAIEGLAVQSNLALARIHHGEAYEDGSV